MPTILKFRRGTTTQNNAFTGAAGELSIDTSLNKIRVHDGSTAGGATVGAGGEVVDDTTPQLGGSLDVNGNAIVSASNGNIAITPNGSGNIVLDGLTFPNADGSANQVLKTNGSGTLSFTDVSGGSGGTSWQAIKTSTFTAVAGEGYFINTSGGAFEMDLPAGSIGDEVAFIDYAGTFDTNALTIDQNGSEKIAGSTDPLTVSVERAANTLVYVDGTQGWLLKNKQNLNKRE